VHTLDHTFEPEPLRRVEVITGVGRRRTYSAAFKTQVVEETLAPDAVVSQVARRHGLTPQQVFGWRREMRERPAGETLPAFAPVLIETRPQQPARAPETAIEITIGRVSVRIPPGTDLRMVATVLRALKARS